MWRIARQPSRAATSLLQCSRFAVRQKHIPTAVKRAVSPARVVTKPASKSSKKSVSSISLGDIDIVDPLCPLSNNEPLFQLPLINIGDYVEAFR